MDSQEIMVREYIAYMESKDKFVERSFLVNRFYLILVLILMTLMFYFSEKQGDDFVSMLVIIFAAAGMCICLLWWLNQDSYAYLIKVKLGGVLEKIEEQLPLKPYKMEYDEIKERNKKKRVMFADLQKVVSFVAFLVFFAMFLYNAGVKVLFILFPV